MTTPKAGEVWRNKDDLTITAKIYEVDADEVFYQVSTPTGKFGISLSIEDFIKFYEPIPTTVSVTVTLPIESAESIKRKWFHSMPAPNEFPYETGMRLFARALRDAEVK